MSFFSCRSLSVLYLTNSLFSHQKNYRILATNTQYFFLFKSSRDHHSLGVLARQIVGPKNYKYVVEAYDYATTKFPYGYLLCDLKVATKKELRFRTRILPGEDTICFVLKDG